jgi:hypothetical protein
VFSAPAAVLLRATPYVNEDQQRLGPMPRRRGMLLVENGD